MATAVETPAPSQAPPPSASRLFMPQKRQQRKRNGPAFAVYSPLPTVRKTPHKDPLPSFTAVELGVLDPSGARARLFDKTRPDAAKVGDVLMVTSKQGEPFAGVCLSIRRRGVDTAILLRGQLMKVGVEMWYKIYSPHVIGIDIVWRRPKRARRARLTYMRKPSHDMGNVDHLVFAWKKERYAMRNKGRGATGALGSRF